MNQDHHGVTGTADREIVTTRVFDAPRDLVFEAWTDPRHLAQWWGPNGFTNTIQEMDVRPGGTWRLVMHGPDGVDYKNESVFREVVKPTRLAYSHLSPPKFEVTVTFEEDGGQTRLTMRMVFDTAENREKVVKAFGAVEGAKQTFGRLAEYLIAGPGITPISSGTSKRLSRTLWIHQALLALLFLFAGGSKLLLPSEELAKQIAVPGITVAFLRFIGVAEVCGALGLVLPGLLRIQPMLTPLAACGLLIIMMGAVAVSLPGGLVLAVFPFAVGLLLAFVAYQRWKLDRVG